MCCDRRADHSSQAVSEEERAIRGESALVRSEVCSRGGSAGEGGAECESSDDERAALLDSDEGKEVGRETKSLDPI